MKIAKPIAALAAAAALTVSITHSHGPAKPQRASVAHVAPANMHTDNMHTDRLPVVLPGMTYKTWEDACWREIPYGPKRFRCFEVGYDMAVAGKLRWQSSWAQDLAAS